MKPPHIRCLPAALTPLADKFYRAQRSPMRTKQAEQVWVAESDEIVGALCLRAVADGFWLTSLLVAATRRNQGIASHLLDRVLAEVNTPVWLFCAPALVDFYARLHFAPAADLPVELAERLSRYQRSKSLIALRYR